METGDTNTEADINQVKDDGPNPELDLVEEEEEIMVYQQNPEDMDTERDLVNMDSELVGEDGDVDVITSNKGQSRNNTSAENIAPT